MISDAINYQPVTLKDLFNSDVTDAQLVKLNDELSDILNDLSF